MRAKLKRIELYIAESLAQLDNDLGCEYFDGEGILERAGGNVSTAIDIGFDYGFKDGEYNGKKQIASKIKAIIDGEDE